MTWVDWCRRQGFDAALGEEAEAALRATEPIRAGYRERGHAGALRVLDAMRRQALSEADLAPSHGYGYHDAGRAKLEAIYAEVMGVEAAIVRPQIVSGTHALAIALRAAARPGGEILLATGEPYDTLHPLLGLTPDAPGSLAEIGVRVRRPEGDGADPRAVADAVGPRTCAVFIQRSRGYSGRASTPVAAIERLIAAVRGRRPEVACVVDNCYGEFVEPLEPGAVGADLVAGSLIKNPGGGLASTGGYVAGRGEWVERAAAFLTAPGLGTDVGPLTGGFKRECLQGLLLAPGIVGQALEGAVFAAEFFRRFGLRTDPEPAARRTDLIQVVECGSRDALVRFCQGVQAAAPVDAHVRPEPWAMPGYDHEVIMAAGTFVQGASIELSADGPLRPPYRAYLQGGLALPLVIAACVSAVAALRRDGLI